MRSPEPPPIPFGRVLAEQIRATGFALAREAMFGGAALALICVLSISMAWRENDQLHFQPELLTPALFFAALLPFAVWKGDKAFGRAFLWTLPVRRQQAAIAKVLAGAAWLMAAMLVTFAALSLVALVSGGGLGAQRMRLLDGGTGDVAQAVQVVWTMPTWMWLMPFVNVLTLYLASSAAILGLRHPIRMVAGAALALALFCTVIINFAPDSAIVNGLGALRHGPAGKRPCPTAFERQAASMSAYGARCPNSSDGQRPRSSGSASRCSPWRWRSEGIGSAEPRLNARFSRKSQQSIMPLIPAAAHAVPRNPHRQRQISS